MNARQTSSGFLTAVAFFAAGCVLAAMSGCEQPYKPANYRAAPRADADKPKTENNRRTANVTLPRVTDWTSPSEIGTLGSGFPSGPYRGGGYRGDVYRGYAFASPYRGNAYSAGAYRGSAYRGFGDRREENRGVGIRGRYPPATSYRGYRNPAAKPYRGYQTSETVYGVPANNQDYRGFQKPSSGGAYRGYRNPIRN